MKICTKRIQNKHITYVPFNCVFKHAFTHREARHIISKQIYYCNINNIIHYCHNMAMICTAPSRFAFINILYDYNINTQHFKSRLVTMGSQSGHLGWCVSRFPCCVLLGLSWNTNENPSTDKLSRAIN